MTAIIFGFLLFASGLTPYEETGSFNAGSIFGGISLFFGAIAYRMAKKKKIESCKILIYKDNYRSYLYHYFRSYRCDGWSRVYYLLPYISNHSWKCVNCISKNGNL